MVIIVPVDLSYVPSTILVSSSVSPYNSQDLGVDLSVGGLDLSLQGSLLMGRAGLRERLMESEHLIHQCDHGTVACDVLGIGFVDYVGRNSSVLPQTIIDLRFPEHLLMRQPLVESPQEPDNAIRFYR
jgi:hypothetical protein